MNPGLFFREVLESHEFRSSDSDFGVVFRVRGHDREGRHIRSDNANLLDISRSGKVRRLLCFSVVESAVMA